MDMNDMVLVSVDDHISEPPEMYDTLAFWDTNVSAHQPTRLALQQQLALRVRWNLPLEWMRHPIHIAIGNETCVITKWLCLGRRE